MSLRCNTTSATFESAAWTPANDMSLLQFRAGDASAMVTLLGRVHADAPYVTVHRWDGGSAGFVRIISMQSFKLLVENNNGGLAVDVWDSE